MSSNKYNKQGRRIILDLEGNNLYPAIDKLWCGVAIDIDTDETFFFFDKNKDTIDYVVEDQEYHPEDLDELPKFLDNCSWIACHNGIGFDFPALKKMYNWEPSDPSQVFDTLVMSRLLNPDRPPVYGVRGIHSVEAWGRRLGKWKPEHEDWSQFSLEMLIRCHEDTKIQFIMYKELCREADFDYTKGHDPRDPDGYFGHNWAKSMDNEIKSSEIMFQQECNGCGFAYAKAIEYTEVLDKFIQENSDYVLAMTPKKVKMDGTEVHKPFKKTGELVKRLEPYSDLPIAGPFCRIYWEEMNLNSNTQLKEWLYTLGWEPDEWNYKKDKRGRIIRDDDGHMTKTSPKITISSLEKIDGHLGQAIASRSKATHKRNQIQGLIDRCDPETHRIPAAANPQGTPTGRMTHIGVANIPKPNVDKETHELIWYPDKQKNFFGTEMRSLFCKTGDRVLIGRDASGLEMRCYAHYLDDQIITDLILDGDIHTYNMNAAGLNDRDQAKTFIYAFLYGAGDVKIGEIVLPQASDHEKRALGKELKTKFFESNPKLEKLVNRVKRASGRGYLIGLDGRKLHMRRDDYGQIQRNKALNTLLQGAGAIIMTHARIWLWEEVAKRGWLGTKALKVIDYHDEETWECDQDIAEELKELMIHSVVQAGIDLKLNIPLDADARIGNSWAEIH